MTNGYQKADQDVVDYQIYRLKNNQQPLRGPEPASLEKNRYFTCLGAAQTFGRFCQQPYPTLLSEAIDLPVLNLGMAGAGPTAFTSRPLLIEHINNSQFAIIQILSGRSSENSLLRQVNHRGNLVRKDIENDTPQLANRCYDKLLKELSPTQMDTIIWETRHYWLTHMQDLLRQIHVPKILFWFSQRDEDYTIHYDKANRLFGQYPQFINYEMIQQLTDKADAYVKSVSTTGMPQRLLNRHTGKPITITLIDNSKLDENIYYPSPQMHQEACAALQETAQKFRHSA